MLGRFNCLKLYSGKLRRNTARLASSTSPYDDGQDVENLAPARQCAWIGQTKYRVAPALAPRRAVSSTVEGDSNPLIEPMPPGVQAVPVQPEQSLYVLASTS